MKDTPFCIGSDHLPGFSKLIEEMGETHQVIGKIMGKGDMGVHWDGQALKDSLEEELADVVAAINFVIDHNGLDFKAIKKRGRKKLDKFNRWHDNIQAGLDPNHGKEDK